MMISHEPTSPSKEMLDTSKILSPLHTSSEQRIDTKHDRSDTQTSRPRSPLSEQSKGLFDQGRRGDMYQPAHCSAPPRESLPSITSLFGGVPPSNRPAQSPYSDRQSPIFPSRSPRDGRISTTPLHSDRAFDTNFQRSAPSRNYPHATRPDSLDRLGYPAPAARPNPGPMPESPRYAPPFPQHDLRQGPSPSGNNWTPLSVSPRQDHFPILRDQYRHQSHLSRAEHESRQQFYRDHAPAPRNYLPTPAGTVMGEPVTVKDGLGPKIWTGTQFLPRFVRQAEVAGEGQCYFYDDGTHCKTVIDGEIVNAHWGVTKAGKPRKRLAIACITCREKKIKCDPDYPRCVQCDKFGRVCKFKNAPRGGHNSPDTPPADSEDILPRPGSSLTDCESFRVEEREGSNSVSPRPNLRRATPEAEPEPHTKRQRNGYSEYTPVASEASPRLSVQDTASPSTSWAEVQLNDHTLRTEWQNDPFHSTETDIADEILAKFFKYVPETAHFMFPKNQFTVWARYTGHKSLNDLMLIYSILALGAVFSPKSKYKHLAARYAAIARYACDSRQPGIQLVQARLMLALYYFAINNPNDAWDFCGSAARAATGLKLNVEIEKSDDAYLTKFPFGLNFGGYAECRRRTFWACYLMDRFNGFGSGHLSMIDSKHVYLRLPCDEGSFGDQVNVQNPLFEVSSPRSQDYPRTLGLLGYLINVTTIWGDVMSNIYGNAQRPEPTRTADFNEFYKSTMDRLSSWKSTLPDHFAIPAESLEKVSGGGELGTCILMHAVYHTTMMKLHRYTQPYGLDESQNRIYVSIAQQHARLLLDIMNTVANRSKSNGMRSPSSYNFIEFSSPFVGYAIISAVDILSAKPCRSSLRGLIESFYGAQTVINEIAQFWHMAKTQKALIAQRITELHDLECRDWSASAKELSNGTFEMREPLEKTFSRENDGIYQ